MSFFFGSSKQPQQSQQPQYHGHYGTNASMVSSQTLPQVPQHAQQMPHQQMNMRSNVPQRGIIPPPVPQQAQVPSSVPHHAHQPRASFSATVPLAVSSTASLASSTILTASLMNPDLVICKIYMNDEIRRIKLPHNATLAGLYHALHLVTKIPKASIKTYYMDDEKDWIRFSDASEWSDMLEMGKNAYGGTMLKIKVEKVADKAQQPQGGTAPSQHQQFINASTHSASQFGSPSISSPPPQQVLSSSTHSSHSAQNRLSDSFHSTSSARVSSPQSQSHAMSPSYQPQQPQVPQQFSPQHYQHAPQPLQQTFVSEEPEQQHSTLPPAFNPNVTTSSDAHPPQESLHDEESVKEDSSDVPAYNEQYYDDVPPQEYDSNLEQESENNYFSSAPQEESYSTFDQDEEQKLNNSLSLLFQMGFVDEPLNRQLLQKHNGNVRVVLQELAKI